MQSDLPGVGQDQADQHLHQRRLAGPVLAEDAVDPAAVQREVDVVAGDDPPEPLGDVDELRGGRGVGRPARAVIGRLGHELRSARRKRLAVDLAELVVEVAGRDLRVHVVHRGLLLGRRRCR